MKITKRKTNKPAPVVLAQGESKAWRYATFVFALATLLALTSCASTPPDLKALQEENARLQRALEECESDSSQCLDLLIECEGMSE